MFHDSQVWSTNANRNLLILVVVVHILFCGDLVLRDVVCYHSYCFLVVAGPTQSKREFSYHCTVLKKISLLLPATLRKLTKQSKDEPFSSAYEKSQLRTGCKFVSEVRIHCISHINTFLSRMLYQFCDTKCVAPNVPATNPSVIWWSHS